MYQEKETTKELVIVNLLKCQSCGEIFFDHETDDQITRETDSYIADVIDASNDAEAMQDDTQITENIVITLNLSADDHSLDIVRDGKHVGFLQWHDEREPRIELHEVSEGTYLTLDELLLCLRWLKERLLAAGRPGAASKIDRLGGEIVTEEY